MLNDSVHLSLNGLSSEIRRIVDAKPEFASLADVRSSVSIDFHIALPVDAGSYEEFRIRVSSAADGIEAREIGGRLPKGGCPQRHINFDGSLCLGLAPNGTRIVRNETESSDWWKSLESHLQSQVIAEISGRWRASQEVSHGFAGVWQVRAEELAASLGIKDQYKLGIEKSDGAFGKKLPKIRNGTSRLVNQRAICPCGRPLAGQKNHLRRNCPDKWAVFQLVEAEWKRRDADNEFWKDAKKKGRKCCGTMKVCPLRE